MKLLTHAHSGFTLIEVIIALSILIIITASTLSTSMSGFHRYSFRGERDQFIHTLQKARSDAMNTLCIGDSCTTGLAHGVHVSIVGNQYILFQGNTYNSTDSTNQIFSLNTTITVSGFSDIVYERLSGTTHTIPAGVWALTLSDTSGHTSTITTNSEGLLAWSN